MERSSYSPALRWGALAVTAGNIAFQYLYQDAGAAPTVTDVTWRYESVFRPAGYAFSIWGLIFLSWLAYAVWQVLPVQRRHELYDRLAPGVILSGLLNAAWLVAFRMEWIGLAELVLVLALAIAIRLFVLARKAVAGTYPWWVAVPFSLYAGWLTVAVIANTCIWLVSMGIDRLGLGPAGWAIVLLAAAGVIGLAVGLGQRDAIYPLVVAWGCVGVAVQQFYQHPVVAWAGAGAAALLILGAGAVLLGRKGQAISPTG